MSHRTTIHTEHTIAMTTHVHLELPFPGDRMTMLMHTAILAIAISLSIAVGYRYGRRAAYSDFFENLAEGQQALLNTTANTYNYVKLVEEKLSQLQETSQQLNHCKAALHKTEQAMNRCWICS